MEDKVRKQLIELLQSESRYDIRYITRISFGGHASSAIVEFVDNGGNYFRRRFNVDGTVTEMEV